ncbi:MAG: caspase family protein [Deltaproteobacteria bacterium]|nr:caspase family protein [Deltaproteobacteria bacterium]
MVVGVSNYRSWPKLPDATTDAGAIAKRLEKIGFNVKLVMDPTYRQMETILRDLVNPIGNKVNRGVLFYYIGHGATANLADNTRMGYIIPVDCPRLSQDPDGFLRHAISMKEIEAASMRMKAKHVIMLFDACFSGSQFVLERPAPEAITSKSNMPVRQYIIAGRENEKPPNQPMFNRCVLMGLDGYADLSDDGNITGSELALYLSDIVANSTQRKQHPQYGKINNPSLDKGDFVFVTGGVLAQVSVDSGRQKELEKEIKALDAAILKAKDEQRKMEAKRTTLMEKLSALRGETGSDKETPGDERAASEAPQLDKTYKASEAQRPGCNRRSLPVFFHG